MGRLMEPATVAERLGVSDRTIRRLVDQGLLPAVKVGKQLRFEPERVEDWIRQGGAGLRVPGEGQR
jgi:excisionase family DNA binding protein